MFKSEKALISFCVAIISLMIAPMLFAQNAPPAPAVAPSQSQAVTFGAQNLNFAPYPLNALPLTATNSATTLGFAVTLPAVAGKTTYLCGYEIDATATSIATASLVITGTISGSLATFYNITPQATSGATQTFRTFQPCIPASAANTAIVLTFGVAGAGGAQAANAWGFQL
jgi:hypothetical protein